MTAEEILVKAAELVERPNGWCQKTLIRFDGAVCMMGAIIMADGVRGMDGLFQYRESLEALCATIAVKKEMGGWEAAVDFNNTPGRTPEEVALVLRNSKRHL